MIIVVSENERDRRSLVGFPLHNKGGCKHVLNTKQSKAANLKKSIVARIEIVNLHGW
jgi:hypothetical protein